MTSVAEIDTVRRARVLIPLLLANAGQAERDTRPTGETLAAVRDAGLFRLQVPRELGGLGLDLRGQCEAIVEVGRGCPSTGWLVALNTTAARLALAKFGAPGAAIFRDDPDVLLCSIGNSRSIAKRVSGGYLVSGKGGFASGCEIADRVLLWGVPMDNSTTRVSVFVPASEIRVERTWDCAGMRGTGSHTVVLTDVFVPDELSSVAEFDAARRAYDNLPIPQDLIKSIAIALPVFVGAVRGALDCVRETLTHKGISDTVYQAALDSPSARHWLAEAEHLVDSAYQHMWLVADELDAAPQVEPMALADRVRVRMHMSSTVSLCRQAMAKLLDLAGASAFATANPIQRFWRDIEVGTRHARLNPFIATEDYGRFLAAGEPPTATLI